MEKLANALFSMRGMAVGMIIFFVAIAKATFIESAETTQAAKVWVYNALWFELLLVFLSINLVANIMRYKMWRREKTAVFAFHLSFLIIILGAALTRYAGFEGMMSIREGESTNQILAAEPYVYLNVNNGKMQYRDSVKKYMAEGYWNKVNFEASFPGRNPVTIEYVDFKSKHIDSLIYDPESKLTALDIVVDGMQSKKLMPEDDMDLGGVVLSYSKAKVEGISIFKQGDSLVIKSTLPMQSIAMSSLQKSQRQAGAQIADSLYTTLQPNTISGLKPRTLYQFAGRQFVFKQAIPNMRKEILPSGSKKRGTDYLTLLIKDGSKSKTVTLTGGIDDIGVSQIFSFNGLNYSLAYGRRYLTIPFTVSCIDFQMERYPGSSMASSFSSDIDIKDDKNGVNKKKHLYMNHVVDYDGYRFFQSSYDEDEKGTVLSVNYDWWGTNVTYLGYLLMSIGMILTLLARGGRFKELLSKLNKSNKAAGILILSVVLSSLSFGQEAVPHNHDHNHQHSSNHTVVAEKPVKPIVRFISEEHSEELAQLLVQDFKGRIVPFHTVSDELLRKIYRSNKYEGKNAVQIILSMHMYPQYWREQKIVFVPAAVREKLKLENYASFNDLTVPSGPDGRRDYTWTAEYEAALHTPEVKQNEFQKKLIKLTEKFEVLIGIESSFYLKIVPVKGEANNTWYSPISEEAQNQSVKGCELTFRYFGWLYENVGKTSDYQVAKGYLTELKKFQRANTKADVLPTETHVNVEISYNKMGIFKNTESMYFLLGTLLLILFLVRELANSDKRFFTISRKVLIALMLVMFLYHLAGLIIRGYISGHVPWSDGYEALLYIAWVAVLAGFIFARKNGAIIACAALLAGCMIMVTELELLDPEITPLQPVLKSYWLKVHVAVITASYAFLGLACILGLVNLILFISRGKKNGQRITRNINELTYVSELTMTIGTFMLTIGTFLGGIWANESWGRYWGWDPKETWALVSVLVYAIILHMRYIPGLNGKFVFNLLGFWGYAAILFTFFGVNFILVGLHSYANGDGAVSLPNYIWYTVALFVVLTVIAGMRNRSYNKKLKSSL